MTEPGSRAPSPLPAGRSGVALNGRVGPDDAPSLCARLLEAAGCGEGALSCDCAGVDDPDVGTVEALARMALTARRLGQRLELRRLRPDLGELLGLTGLAGLAVEVVGEPEQREEPGGIEEEGDPADPIA